MAGLLWFRDAGGRAWQRHFAGAVGFFALGVPWPTIVEQAITGILMPVNAALTLEALHWLGVPAIRTGNLITLREGTLGVEEACSGIRSLQATLMMALFLGELHLLRLRDRGLLLALGGGLALATNAVRTTVLSVMAARAGMAEADRWHDGVGLTVLTIHGLALFAVTLAFTRRCPRNPKISQPRHLPLAWPARGPAVLAGALIITAPATHFWYARNELPQTADWSLTPPREAPKFEELTIPHRIRLILRHDAGWSGRWQTEEGHRLHAYYLEWNPGSVPPGSLAAHTPGHCLSHIGMTLESESSPPLVIQGPMGSMPVSCLRFNDRGEALFVAHAVQALNYTEPSLLKSDGRLTYRKRLRAAWRGQRNEGQRLIEIGLWGVSSEAEAREIFLGFFQNRIAFATRP
jgi:exosortase